MPAIAMRFANVLPKALLRLLQAATTPSTHLRDSPSTTTATSMWPTPETIVSAKLRLKALSPLLPEPEQLDTLTARQTQHNLMDLSESLWMRRAIFMSPTPTTIAFAKSV